MMFVHYTFKDSTPRVPHFEINVFIGNEWVGHYPRNGEWIENEHMHGRCICKKNDDACNFTKEAATLFGRNNNQVAQHCYESVGFKPRTVIEDMTEMVYGYEI
jgi:hypothetical protein